MKLGGTIKHDGTATRWVLLLRLLVQACAVLRLSVALKSLVGLTIHRHGDNTENKIHKHLDGEIQVTGPGLVQVPPRNIVCFQNDQKQVHKYKITPPRLNETNGQEKARSGMSSEQPPETPRRLAQQIRCFREALPVAICKYKIENNEWQQNAKATQHGDAPVGTPQVTIFERNYRD